MGNSHDKPKPLRKALSVPNTHDLPPDAPFLVREKSRSSQRLPQSSGKSSKSGKGGKKSKHHAVAEQEIQIPYTESVFLPEFPLRGDVEELDFDVVDVIAKGAYGNVIKVQREDEKRFYAVKVLDKAQILHDGAINQCKDEASIQSMAGNHPFVVKAYEYWQSHRSLYIVLDYIPHGDMFTLWTFHGSFPEELVKLYIAELAMVVEYLHESSVIYRDIKMENILFDPRGHIQMTDFGLAKRLQRGDQTRTVCGTLQYMAPEVLSVYPYGHPADWWSVGILMYAMLVGKYPVDGLDTHTRMAQKVFECDYLLPGHISNLAQDVINRVLTKSPHKRLSDLDTLQDLHFFQDLIFSDLIDRMINPADVVPPDFFPMTGVSWAPQPLTGEDQMQFDEFDDTNGAVVRDPYPNDNQHYSENYDRYHRQPQGNDGQQQIHQSASYDSQQRHQQHHDQQQLRHSESYDSHLRHQPQPDQQELRHSESYDSQLRHQPQPDQQELRHSESYDSQLRHQPNPDQQELRHSGSYDSQQRHQPPHHGHSDSYDSYQQQQPNWDGYSDSYDSYQQQRQSTNHDAYHQQDPHRHNHSDSYDSYQHDHHSDRHDSYQPNRRPSEGSYNQQQYLSENGFNDSSRQQQHQQPQRHSQYEEQPERYPYDRSSAEVPSNSRPHSVHKSHDYDTRDYQSRRSESHDVPLRDRFSSNVRPGSDAGYQGYRSSSHEAQPSSPSYMAPSQNFTQPHDRQRSSSTADAHQIPGMYMAMDGHHGRSIISQRSGVEDVGARRPSQDMVYVAPSLPKNPPPLTLSSTSTNPPQLSSAPSVKVVEQAPTITLPPANQRQQKDFGKNSISVYTDVKGRPKVRALPPPSLPALVNLPSASSTSNNVEYKRLEESQIQLLTSPVITSPPPVPQQKQPFGNQKPRKIPPPAPPKPVIAKQPAVRPAIAPVPAVRKSFNAKKKYAPDNKVSSNQQTNFNTPEITPNTAPHAHDTLTNNKNNVTAFSPTDPDKPRPVPRPRHNVNKPIMFPDNDENSNHLARPASNQLSSMSSNREMPDSNPTTPVDDSFKWKLPTSSMPSFV